MEAIDIEAKTIDEAIEKACREFQTTREKLKIEIIAEGNPGFLGFGAKKALIRAEILQIDRELDNLINGAAASAPVFLPEGRPSPRLAAPPSPVKKETANKPEGKSSAGNQNKVKASTPPGLHRITNDVDHPRPELHRTTNGVDHPRPALPPHRGGINGEGPSEAAASGQPEAIKALELVEGILTRMNIPAQVELLEAEDVVMLTILGDGDGLLIGKKGQNLDAIQYIVNKAVHHSINDGKRIVIDTEEYRKRREDSLLTTALQTAQKVRKTRKPVTLGPMNPHDRRIIHIALKNDKTLTTKSRGEGEYRKIVIIPARRGVADENA